MDTTLVINLLIGLVAGVLAGMFGIGGGVVIVPALILLSGFSIVLANGTSLAALLLPVGILAVMSYYRADLIDLKISGLMATGLIIGVIAGSFIALNIPTNSLKFIYGLFLLYVSWNFMKPMELWRKYIRKEEIIIENKQEKSHRDYKLYFFPLVGLSAGVMSGLFGIGGGLVIVPMLIAFLHMDTKRAVGTSLGALLLPVTLPGVLIYYNAGQLNIPYAVTVAAGLVLGALVGAKITISLPAMTVKRIYSLFLLFMGINFIYTAIIAEL
jgi:uncharacterized membrane protein YfcA